jgi:hypothetical protein
MRHLDAILRWQPGGSRATLAPVQGTEPSRPWSVVHWALAVWTALGGLAMLFFQGSFSRAMAGGLTDAAGQRMLGLQALLLSVVYAAAAQTRRGWLSWLPLCGQAGLVVVLLFDTLSGHRGFASAAPALLSAFAFALLLGAFRLAGDATVHHVGVTSDPAAEGPAVASFAGKPTERLAPRDVSSAGGYQESRGPDQHPRAGDADDSVLGA